ncbi:MAG: FadR/GntR family transcriptional regulator [Halieaceae bacterium]|nr:FadR/GntR family transcriptional regulator [Halieaceae bacterium]
MMKDKRLYQSVADRIAGLIDSGIYPPGSRLPGERELAETLEVSRVTVREAEIFLQALGRIDIKTGSGAYVRNKSDQSAGGIPSVSAFELTEARSLFESEAAALAAPDIDNEVLNRLETLIEKMMSDEPDGAQVAEQADRDFHLTIASSTGNKAVLYIVETLWKMRMELEQVREVYDSVCSEDSAARGQEHTEILEALRSRDSGAARSAMRQHFTRLLKSMLDVTEEQAFEELRQRATASRERFLKSAQL